MAWTAPRTWVANETVTAAIMNTHVRDNLNDLDGRVAKKPFMVWLATANQPPSANAATPDFRNGHPVLDFDAAGTEYAIFAGVLEPTYNSGGLTIELYWMSTNQTSGNVKWDAEIESHTPDADDLDADSFAAANSTTDTTASAAGELIKTAITFSDGADMDSLAAGESFRLRISRDGADAGDTMSNDAELLKVVLRET